MGKNLTIYFQDDALELIEHYAGKGTLLNNLVREHFSNDEEILRDRMRKLDLELNQVRGKITRLQEDKVKRLNEMKRKQKDTEKDRERRRIVERFKAAWTNKTVNDDDYFNCVIDGKFDLEKVKKMGKKYSLQLNGGTEAKG